MPSPCYLAMTAAELDSCAEKPPYTAWMACHFSPYATGLSNLPTALPEGSMLLVNDRTPVCGHNPQRIAQQLEQVVQELHCSRIYLDFQRPNEPETAEIVRCVAALPCSVGVSAFYAKEAPCAVCLPPLPLTTPLQDYLAPWENREIWLELATDCQKLTLTEQGCKRENQINDACSFPHADAALFCQYHTAVTENSIIFSLRRDVEQLKKLIEEGSKLGISCFVGLYQQLGADFAQADK